MSEQRNYMEEVQALIDLKWKENPEEMKRVMADIKAKEKAKKKKPKVETPKGVSFDPELTQELIKEMSQSFEDIDIIIIQALLDRGADVEAKDSRGWTPLHVASTDDDIDNIETAKFLIEKGADVEAKDQWGNTPLHWATMNNSIEATKLLIEKGADVEAKNINDETPLHLASWENHIEIAKFLIEKGADVDAKNNYGKTPLDVADSDEMRELLQKYM
jgi:ankyrin repeat protein